jgi:uncharacterized repeat protein (TIGR01451 family)
MPPRSRLAPALLTTGSVFALAVLFWAGQTALTSSRLSSSLIAAGNCGNGTLDVGEACDNGPSNGQYSGCNADCTVQAGWVCGTSINWMTGTRCHQPKCGDGILDPTEQCDRVLGEWIRDLGCGNSEHCDTFSGCHCVYDARCGNGIVDQGEGCDSGAPYGSDGCDSSCQVKAGWTCTGSPSVCTQHGVCGNGRIENASQGVPAGTETCDDLNTNNGDGCSSTCQIEAGWHCPGGSPTSGCYMQCPSNGNAGTSVQCVPGVVACRDGGQICSTDCRCVYCDAAHPCTGGAFCQDGYCVAYVGPRSSQPYVPPYVPPTTPAVCGNGVVETGEICERDADCGGYNSGGKCVRCQCQFPICGDGVRQQSEQCEKDSDCTSWGTNAFCDNCQCKTPICGNGIQEYGEKCENDSQCPNGYKCQGCFCQAPFSCNRDNFNYPTTECATDADCGTGHACKDCICRTCTGGTGLDLGTATAFTSKQLDYVHVAALGPTHAVIAGGDDQGSAELKLVTIDGKNATVGNTIPIQTEKPGPSYLSGLITVPIRPMDIATADDTHAVVAYGCNVSLVTLANDSITLGSPTPMKYADIGTSSHELYNCKAVSVSSNAGVVYVAVHAESRYVVYKASVDTTTNTVSLSQVAASFYGMVNSTDSNFSLIVRPDGNAALLVPYQAPIVWRLPFLADLFASLPTTGNYVLMEIPSADPQYYNNARIPVSGFPAWYAPQSRTYVFFPATNGYGSPGGVGTLTMKSTPQQSTWSISDLPNVSSNSFRSTLSSLLVTPSGNLVVVFSSTAFLKTGPSSYAPLPAILADTDQAALVGGTKLLFVSSDSGKMQVGVLSGEGSACVVDTSCGNGYPDEGEECGDKGAGICRKDQTCSSCHCVTTSSSSSSSLPISCNLACPPPSYRDPNAVCACIGGSSSSSIAITLSSSSSSTPCITEGQDAVVSTSCCAGLTAVQRLSPDIGGLCNGDGNLFVCTSCGNGTCSAGENTCNCPADCAGSSSSAVAGVIDLRVTIADSVEYGQTATYSATLTNLGNSTVSNLVYIDSVPSGIAFDATLSDSNCRPSSNNPQNIFCTKGDYTNGFSLAKGESITFALIFNVNSCYSPLPNISYVRSINGSLTYAQSNVSMVVTSCPATSASSSQSSGYNCSPVHSDLPSCISFCPSTVGSPCKAFCSYLPTQPTLDTYLCDNGQKVRTFTCKLFPGTSTDPLPRTACDYTCQ